MNIEVQCNQFDTLSNQNMRMNIYRKIYIKFLKSVKAFDFIL